MIFIICIIFNGFAALFCLGVCIWGFLKLPWDLAIMNGVIDIFLMVVNLILCLFWLHAIRIWQ